MNNLSQKDSKWKNIKIGNSNSTIGDYGCLITSIAILSDTTPVEVNDYLTKNNGYSNDLVIWEKITKFVKKTDTPIYPCIAMVDAPYMHFVVMLDDNTIIDPIDGKTRPIKNKYKGIRKKYPYTIKEEKNITMKNNNTNPDLLLAIKSLWFLATGKELPQAEIDFWINGTWWIDHPEKTIYNTAEQWRKEYIEPIIIARDGKEKALQIRNEELKALTDRHNMFMGLHEAEVKEKLKDKELEIANLHNIIADKDSELNNLKIKINKIEKENTLSDVYGAIIEFLKSKIKGIK